MEGDGDRKRKKRSRRPSTSLEGKTGPNEETENGSTELRETNLAIIYFLFSARPFIRIKLFTSTEEEREK